MAELKTVDSTPTAITGTASGSFAATALSYPVQGAGANQRQGDSIYLHSYSLRGFVDCGSTQNNIMRIITFQWLEDDNVTTPNSDDVLADTTVGNILTSHYVVNPPKRFKILDDSVYTWDSNTASAPKPWSVQIRGRDFASHDRDWETT